MTLEEVQELMQRVDAPEAILRAHEAEMAQRLIPVPTAAPPLGGGHALTREDVARMSEAEINRRWAEIRALL